MGKPRITPKVPGPQLVVIHNDPNVCMVQVPAGHQDSSRVIAPDRAFSHEGKTANFVATIGDKTTCPFGGCAYIMSGATDFLLDESPIARQFDITDHNTTSSGAAMAGGGDSILLGTKSGILVGGGTTFGNVKAAKAACEALKAGRTAPANADYGQDSQRYENCGIESVRSIVNAKKGTQYTEEEMFIDAIAADQQIVELPKELQDKLDSTCGPIRTPDEPEEDGLDAKTLNSPEYKRYAKAGVNYAEAKQKLDDLNQQKANADEKTKGILNEKIAKSERDLILKEYELRQAEIAWYRSEAYQQGPGAMKKACIDCRKKILTEYFATHEEAKRKLGTGNTAHRRNLLQRHGIASHTTDNSLQGIDSSVCQGKGVIVATSGLPGKDGKQMGDHIVVVVGFEYNENGTLKNVIYNDSIAGCAQKLDGAEFGRKLHGPPTRANVTNEKIW